MNKLTSASVKVMRSFDYCHFEICLSSDDVSTPESVDALRKHAARFADKAVEQYKIMKNNAAVNEIVEQQQGYRKQEAESIRKKAECDRTVHEKATLKEYEDSAWVASREYDYQDDWQGDEPV